MKIDRNNYEAYILDYLEGDLSPEERLAVEVFLLENPDLNVHLDEELPKLESEDLKKVSFDNLKKDIVWDEEEASILILNKLEDEAESHDLERLKQFRNHFPNELAKLEKILSLSVLKANEVALPELDKLNLFQEVHGDEESLLIAYVEGDLSIHERKSFETELSKSIKLKEKLKVFQATKLVAGSETLSTDFKSSLKRKAGIVIPFWIKSAAAAAVLLAFLIPFASNSDQGGVAEFTPREMKDIEETSESAINDLAFLQVKGVKNNSINKASNSQLVKPLVNETYVEPISLELAEISSRISLLHSEIDFSSTFLDSEPIALEPIITDYSSYDYEEPLAYTEPLTPTEAILEKIESAATSEDPNNFAALALVNKAAKSIADTEDDFIVLENNRKKDKGFKFSIGKLSIESTR